MKKILHNIKTIKEKISAMPWVKSLKLKKSQQKKQSEFRMIFEGLLIAVIIRSFIIQPFTIPSGSMYPVLKEGDFIVVTKFSYGFTKYSLPFGDILPFSGRMFSDSPERGDVAVFRLKSKNVDYIKRVIGLPGDSIQMRLGKLYINNTMVQKEQVEYTELENGCAVPTYKETLPNGKSYFVWETMGDLGMKDNTEEYIVPEGHYFMMGDNRDNSTDSRFLNNVGFVKEDAFLGPARMVVFSITDTKFWQVWKWFTNIRTDRFFESIK